MKAKFEEFNDGIAAIYNENDDGQLEKAFANDFRFGEENVSITRHYAARSSDEQVDKMIHVQMQRAIKVHQYVVIEDDQYLIGKVDHIKDSLPPITKLSLQLQEKHRQKAIADGII